MKRNHHHSLTSVGLALGWITLGCSAQKAPAEASHRPEDPVVEVPNADEESTRPLPRAPFPPPIVWGDADPACKESERPITVHREKDAFNTCAPTVHQGDLAAHEGGGTILIDAPVFTKYARRSGLKSGWDSPGIALLQPDGALVPLTKDGQFLGCGGRRLESETPAPCPGEGAARVLGSVTRHEFPGRGVPDYSFELLAAEPASTETKPELPVASPSYQTRALPLAQSCDEWKKCDAGETCVHWEHTGPLCLPELSSLDAVAASQHSRVVVLRQAPAAIEPKTCTRECDSQTEDTLVLTRKKGAAVTVTRPRALGLSSPVECGTRAPSPSFAACPLSEKNERVVGVIRPLGSSARGVLDLEFELLARGVPGGTASGQPAGGTPAATPTAAAVPPPARAAPATPPAPPNSGETATPAPKSGLP